MAYSNRPIHDIGGETFVRLDVIEGEEGSPRWAAFVASGRTATVKLTETISVNLVDIELVLYPRSTVVMAKVAGWTGDEAEGRRLLKDMAMGTITAFVSDSGLNKLVSLDYVNSLSAANPGLDLRGYDNLYVAHKAGLI
ncbi:hypothetical protein CZP2022_5 [Vibrio phage C-ZP2022]|nr:hypothetical protein CZP2022_5 [Vibrio phage C-ZP2022]